MVYINVKVVLFYCMNVKEAAQSLDVSIPTIRNWIAQGKLKAIKINGKNGLEQYIEEEEIDRIRYQREQEQQTIILQQNVPLVVVQRMFDDLSATFRVEIDQLRNEIREEIKQEFVLNEQRIAERDKQLMTVLREIQEIRRQEAEKRGFWGRLFNRGG